MKNRLAPRCRLKLKSILLLPAVTLWLSLLLHPFRLLCSPPTLPSTPTMTQPGPSASSASSATATEPPERDVEAQKARTQPKASHWQLVIDQTHVTPEVLNWPYKGSGTEDDPFEVEYIDNDRRNPMLFSIWKKWMITILVAFVSFSPSSPSRTNGLGIPFESCVTEY